MKKQVIIYIGIVVVLIGLIVGGFYLYQSGILFPKTKPAPVATKICPTSNDGKTVTLKGKESSTVSDLLNQNCDITSSGSGEMTFIDSINGKSTNPNSEYWSYKVNGEIAMVGAGSYITKENDTIVWEITAISF